MFARKDLMRYISDYLAECNRLGVHFKKVILFGSYAHNNAHEWSDVDLALVSDNFSGMIIDDNRKISRANIKFVDIEPHMFNSAYFDEGDPFIEEIKKTGEEIELSQGS